MCTEYMAVIAGRNAALTAFGLQNGDINFVLHTCWTITLHWQYWFPSFVHLPISLVSFIVTMHNMNNACSGCCECESIGCPGVYKAVLSG